MALLPAGLRYVDAAVGEMHTVELRSDGSVVAWSDNGAGQCNMPPLQVGVGCVQVAAGGRHSVARRSDGSLVAFTNAHGEAPGPRERMRSKSWGANDVGQCDVPALEPGLAFVRLSVAGDHTVALIGSGSYATFAPGCPGSAGPTHLLADTAPRLGANLSVVLAPLP